MVLERGPNGGACHGESGIRRREHGAAPAPLRERNDPYQGSSWWSLTAGCVNYVLDFLSRTPEYTRFHRSAGHGRRGVLPQHRQGIPLCCEDQPRLRGEPAHPQRERRALHRLAHEGVPLPKTLDETDFQALAASPALFARKFDSDKSSRLIALIEERLCQPDGARAVR